MQSIAMVKLPEAAAVVAVVAAAAAALNREIKLRKKKTVMCGVRDA